MASRFRNIIILAVVLATSMGCAKRVGKKQVFQAGLGYCGNSLLADFDVMLARSEEYPGNFSLRIVTINVNKPGGAYVRAALANKNMDVQEIVQNKLLRENQVLFNGIITREQLELYDLLVIAPRRGSGGILDGESEGDEAICELPTRDTTG